MANQGLLRPIQTVGHRCLTKVELVYEKWTGTRGLEVICLFFWAGENAYPLWYQKTKLLPDHVQSSVSNAELTSGNKRAWPETRFQRN